MGEKCLMKSPPHTFSVSFRHEGPRSGSKVRLVLELTLLLIENTKRLQQFMFGALHHPHPGLLLIFKCPGGRASQIKVSLTPCHVLCFAHAFKQLLPSGETRL